MSMELQRLVDSLAKRLQRAVAIDDRQVRLLAHSSHEGGEVDPMRRHSILNRTVPPAVVARVHGVGLRATEPFVLPPAPELGLELSRVGVPIRSSGTVLGWLWLLQADEALEPASLEAAVEAAHAAAVVFQRDLLADELSSSRRRELLPALLGDDDQARAHAHGSLIDADLFVARTPVIVLAVELGAPPGLLCEDDRVVVEHALDEATRHLAPRTHMGMVRHDHAVLVVSATEQGVRPHGPLAVARTLLDTLDRHTAPDTRIGIGDPAPGLEAAHASYRQARQAALVSRVVGGMGRVTPFAEIGIYGLLARIPPPDLNRDVLPGGLRVLLDLGATGRPLVDTLETYLDHAGDAQATAARLGVHRTTLYYRLGRVEKLADVDLRLGEHRLRLHLGLKVARIAGLLAAE